MRKHTDAELAVDLAVAEAMVAALEDYLFSDRLFYQLVVRTPLGARQPKLTIGGLLERLHQLKWGRDELDPAQRGEVDGLEEAYADVKRRWSELFEQKVRRELRSLLDSWRWFMQDCEDRHRRCQSEYPSEVWIHTRIVWLMDELPGADLSEEQGRLARLDARLRRVFRAGSFVWDPELEPFFPRSEYWWLYGRPEIPEPW
jgi:hypothetical protein